MTAPIPAAQYVRMSTEHQQYSLDNQSAAISEYAGLHGFTVTRTYSDAAKSGLVLQRREGLMQLLRDVIMGDNDYRVILVYDVSRWGRFQDTDESAHYEFLCKSAGVPVCYCAEVFENDGTMASALLKSVKRSMAGEFSRELGIKVYEGKKRLSLLGFSVGGRTPYGLRRKIVSENDQRSRVLEAGERKNVRGERLTLVLGPSHEVQSVREIFKKVLRSQMTPREIARDLNGRSMRQRDKRWTKDRVYTILTNPIYAGCCTWGRTSRKLKGPLRKLDPSQWILKPGAFSPIVKKSDFDRVQRLLSQDVGRRFWTRQRVLKAAAQLLKEKGRLSYAIFERTPSAPSIRTIGLLLSFADLCREVGYRLPRRYIAKSNSIKRAFSLQRELVHNFADRFRDDVSILVGRRARMLLDNYIEVSLLVCRALPLLNENPRWTVNPVPSESANVSLICCLNAQNTAPHRFFVFPKIDLPGKHIFKERDTWLRNGMPLEDISQFCELARLAYAQRNVTSP